MKFLGIIPARYSSTRLEGVSVVGGSENEVKNEIFRNNTSKIFFN